MGLIKGLHHVSMKCNTSAEYARTRMFYKDVLNLKIAKEWKGGIMFDTGSGIIEVFEGPDKVDEKGQIRHFALETDDVDACVAAVKKAGFIVFIDPNDMVIPTMPVTKIRMAFCYGPMREEIEFIQFKN